MGASGGLITIWNSSLLSGTLVEVQRYGIVVDFISVHNSEKWRLVNVYGPCQGEERAHFVSWLYNFNIDILDNWLILGDFNFIRSSDNRSRGTGDLNDMFLFNDVIGHLGLIELPIKGRSFTWSNMQADPLLVQLDWFFTSVNWTLSYPNTQVLQLAKSSSDHLPCVVVIGTCIPKAKIFRFESFWVDLPGFIQCVQKSWAQSTHKASSAAVLAAKFKRLRHDIKKWSVSLSKIKLLIGLCNKAIFIIDDLEDGRP